MGFACFLLYFSEKHTVISGGRLREKYFVFMISYTMCTIVLLRICITKGKKNTKQ